MIEVEQLYQTILTWLDQQPQVKLTSGETYPGIERDVPVVRGAAAETDFGKIEFNVTTDDAHPHFEWLAEISVDRGGADYTRYLIQPDFKLVRVQRKEITQLNDSELSDLLKLCRSTLV